MCNYGLTRCHKATLEDGIRTWTFLGSAGSSKSAEVSYNGFMDTLHLTEVSPEELSKAQKDFVRACPRCRVYEAGLKGTIMVYMLSGNQLERCSVSRPGLVLERVLLDASDADLEHFAPQKPDVAELDALWWQDSYSGSCEGY